jgi:hypothetical protein
LAAFGKGKSEPTDKLLTAMMLFDVFRLDNVKRFIQPAISHRTFSLF